MPLYERASIYYGQGTRWCTAATASANYYEDYTRSAPLFIVIPRHPKYQGEKYQLWFCVRLGNEVITSEQEWNELYSVNGEDYMINNTEYSQLMDSKDDPVSYRFLVSRFGSGSFNTLIDKISQTYPQLDYAISVSS